MMQDTKSLKERFQDTNIWKRLLTMLLFAVIYSVAEVVLFMVVLFQLMSVLITGQKNAQALTLGAQLSSFVYEVLRYLTFNSDERPYPFSDWPSDAPVQPGVSPSPAPVATEASGPIGTAGGAAGRRKSSTTSNKPTPVSKVSGETKPASSD